MSKEEMITYAQAIKNYCKNNSCIDCPFVDCDLCDDVYPMDWDLPEEQETQNDD